MQNPRHPVSICYNPGEIINSAIRFAGSLQNTLPREVLP